MTGNKIMYQFVAFVQGQTIYMRLQNYTTGEIHDYAWRYKTICQPLSDVCRTDIAYKAETKAQTLADAENGTEFGLYAELDWMHLDSVSTEDGCKYVGMVTAK